MSYVCMLFFINLYFKSIFCFIVTKSSNILAIYLAESLLCTWLLSRKEASYMLYGDSSRLSDH